MNILRVILATIVIFGTGAVSGYFIGKNKASLNAMASPQTASIRGTNSAPPMERGRRSMMDRMQRDLNLSDEQRKTISAIFAASRERSRELWKEIKDPMDSEVKRVHEEVKAVLTAEQAGKFEEINKRRRESFKKNKNGSHSEDPKSVSEDQCSIGYPLTRQCSL